MQENTFCEVIKFIVEGGSFVDGSEDIVPVPDNEIMRKKYEQSFVWGKTRFCVDDPLLTSQR